MRSLVPLPVTLSRFLKQTMRLCALKLHYLFKRLCICCSLPILCLFHNNNLRYPYLLAYMRLVLSQFYPLTLYNVVSTSTTDSSPHFCLLYANQSAGAAVQASLPLIMTTVHYPAGFSISTGCSMQNSVKHQWHV